MNVLLKLLLLLLFLTVVGAVAWYLWKQYKAGVEPSSYNTYYSGFWHYGMLSGVPYEGQNWTSAGALSPTNNPDNASWSPKNLPSPKTNMATYQPFMQGALCAGTYDSYWNMNSSGSITAGDWTNNKAGGTQPSVMVMPYSSSSSDTKYFNWGTLNGNLYNEGVGDKLTVVPNMDPSNYSSVLPPDTAWPPTFMAVTFMAPPTVDNKYYFTYTWSYDQGKLKSSGTLQPDTLPDLSYANTISCTVQLPQTQGSTPSAATTSVTYWLNASGLYYVNRSANPQCLGGPCMLVCPTLGDNWYNSVTTMSFSLMWQQNKVCDVYSPTLKQLQLGGGSCSPAPLGTCPVCYANVAGSQEMGFGTCQSCGGDNKCDKALNKGYVGFWFEFQAPAPNPNSSS